MKENETKTRLEVVLPNDKVVENVNKILSNRIHELNFKMKLLIIKYIVLLRIYCHFLCWMLTTGYLSRYLRKLLKKNFFVLLQLLLYTLVWLLFLSLLSDPVNIITDFCYDTLIALYSWI